MSRGLTEEQVRSEDLVLFINACFACTGQHEFYGRAAEQAVSIQFLHEYILGNYRRLYARTLAAGINHYNQQLIVTNLLATGRDTPPSLRAEEGTLIRATLRRLPPQRSYAVLRTLRRWGVNNRRTRAVAREFLAGRDLLFDAVKYRSKLREAVAHHHLAVGDELGRFLFRGLSRQPPFETPQLEACRQARYSAEAIYELPYTVAEGLAAEHGIGRARFLERIANKMSATEKLRLQTSARHAAAPAPEIDLGKTPLTRLALYVLSLPPEDRERRRDELDAALLRSARRALRKRPTHLGRVAAVLDASYSASGSSAKRRRPLAVALACSYLLRAAAAEYLPRWTTPAITEPCVAARGQTDLATPLLEALAWQPQLLVIVSDGFENDPPGAVEEIIRVFRQRLDPQRATTVIHANPVFDAEHYAPRTLGPSLPTVGLRDAEDLPTLLGFARFADGAAPLSELEDYLSARVEEHLAHPRPRAGGGGHGQAQRR